MVRPANLLDSLVQNGMKKSTSERLEHSLGEQGIGGRGGILDELLGRSAAEPSPAPRRAGAPRKPAAETGGGPGDLLGSLLRDRNGLKAGALGAIAGALLGGGGSKVKNAMGGGALAILGSLALRAFRNGGSQSKEG